MSQRRKGNFRTRPVKKRPDILSKFEDGRKRGFTENGGTLVLAYRTFGKDEDNSLPFGKTPPAGLRGLSGVTVEETENLQEKDE